MYQAYSDPTATHPSTSARSSHAPKDQTLTQPAVTSSGGGHHQRVVSGTLSAKYGRGMLESESEEANRELMHALRGNILESVSIVCQ